MSYLSVSLDDYVAHATSLHLEDDAQIAKYFSKIYPGWELSASVLGYLKERNLTFKDLLALPDGRNNYFDIDASPWSQRSCIRMALGRAGDLGLFDEATTKITLVQNAILSAAVTEALHTRLVNGFMWKEWNPKHEATEIFVNAFLTFAQSWFSQNQMAGNLLTMVSNKNHIELREKLVNDFFNSGNGFDIQCNMGLPKLTGFNCVMFNCDSLSRALDHATGAYKNFKKLEATSSSSVLLSKLKVKN